MREAQVLVKTGKKYKLKRNGVVLVINKVEEDSLSTDTLVENYYLRTLLDKGLSTEDLFLVKNQETGSEEVISESEIGIPVEEKRKVETEEEDLTEPDEKEREEDLEPEELSEEDEKEQKDE